MKTTPALVSSRRGGDNINGIDIQALSIGNRISNKQPVLINNKPIKINIIDIRIIIF